MVFAASVATTLINDFKVQAIVFTGVAGGLKPGQKIGDIVLGKDVVNYEFDCRSFFLPFDPDYKYQLGTPVPLRAAIAAPHATPCIATSVTCGAHAAPLWNSGELPFLKWRFYEADAKMLALAQAAPVSDGVVVSATVGSRPLAPLGSWPRRGDACVRI